MVAARILYNTRAQSKSGKAELRAGSGLIGAGGTARIGDVANHVPAPRVRTSLLATKRAVIVEDEGVTQMQLRRSLTRMGLNVVGVSNTAESSVEIVMRLRPEIVLMDIQTPGAINGIEAARRILEQYDVCIIMLTAYSIDEYKQRADAIGVSGYLLKPVVGETLITDLEKAFASFRTRDREGGC